MIGDMKITVTVLPRTGDRTDTSIRVVGPGETDYTFPLAVTRTAQTIWKLNDDALRRGLEELARGIMEIRGTSRTPPEAGYWFDSANSENTTAETLNKIRNFGDAGFLKDRTVSDEIAAIFGGGLLVELERINETFAEQTGMRLVRPLDYAFEASEATADLGSPPSTKAEFLYRICILSHLHSFGHR